MVSICLRPNAERFSGKTQTQEGRNAATGAIWRRSKKTLAREGTSCHSQVMKRIH
ncbi:hypothetical protein CRE_25849 [Caenorhabditis remanei]|uniref:Uncharacterized protein n=1 Tax=Caenorhabditis remanei TaxID=31234 RepID=E3NAB4_CAERE|nr:hypothetical protein CRE_25849 [Caenorhabditis remanei]